MPCSYRIIYGMSRDKNANQCIRLLLEVAHSEDLFFIQVGMYTNLSFLINIFNVCLPVIVQKFPGVIC